MALFRLPGGTKAISEICLSSTTPRAGGIRKVTMELWGLDEDGDRLEIAPAPGNEKHIRVTEESRPDSMTTRFTIEPLTTKFNAKVVARFAKQQKNGAPKGREYSAPLAVTIGALTRHSGMSVDLFADVLGDSNDAQKLLVYLQSLKAANNDVSRIVDASGGLEMRDLETALADQPLKQKSDLSKPGEFDCGNALKRFGMANFGADHFVTEKDIYYAPFAKKAQSFTVKKSQIKINVDRLNRGMNSIRALLDKKTAVRVFVAHSEPLTVVNSLIAARGTTHYLTIIGYGGGNKFLYLDPWPGGSNLTYAGGILGDAFCNFMGVLELKDGQLVNTSGGSHTGAHGYIVLAGP